MEKIFLIIIFCGPGLMINAIDDFFKTQRKIKKNIYDYFFGIIVHGFIVFITTFILINFIAIFIHDFGFYNGYNGLVNLSQQLNFLTFKDLVLSMDNIKFSFTYLLFTTIVTIVWWRIYDINVVDYMRNIKNRSNTKITGVRTTEYKDVYEGIFHNPDIMYEHLVPVSIYQNGNLVTSGRILNFNSPNAEVMEYQLVDVEEIKEILVQDQSKEEKDKILPYTMFEYYMPEYELLIIFYEPTRLEKHWKQLYSSNN